MYDKLQRREDLRKLYTNTAALDEILNAYNSARSANCYDHATIAAMTQVIEHQVAKGYTYHATFAGEQLTSVVRECQS